MSKRASRKPAPDIGRLVAEHDEQVAIRKAAPTRKALAEALGPFKTCTEPTYVEHADGTDTVKITSEKATPEENARRFSTYEESVGPRTALEIARAQNRNSREGEVIYHDVRTGEVHASPPHLEDRIARKPHFRPGRSRRVYVGFGRAKA